MIPSWELESLVSAVELIVIGVTLPQPPIELLTLVDVTCSKLARYIRGLENLYSLDSVAKYQLSALREAHNTLLKLSDVLADKEKI